jgi:hypothetical protein
MTDYYSYTHKSVMPTILLVVFYNVIKGPSQQPKQKAHS